jgi:hypothetical protein
MPRVLPASAYSANILSQTHLAEPVRQNFTDLHSKHVVQCADGDASNTSLIIIHSVEQRGLLLHKVKLFVNFVDILHSQLSHNGCPVDDLLVPVGSAWLVPLL